MGLIVNLREMLKVEVGVDLGGADIRMAQQLLDRAQVARGFEDMAGKGVPQHMWMHVRRHALLDGTLAQARLD